MRVFLGILDLAVINAFIIFKHINPNFNKLKWKFRQEPSWRLMKPHLEQRIRNPELCRGIRLEEMLRISNNLQTKQAQE